jgi:hypothetical protein
VRIDYSDYVVTATGKLCLFFCPAPGCLFIFQVTGVEALGEKDGKFLITQIFPAP